MGSFVSITKNHRSNRKSLEIIRDILGVALVKTKKTRIMYQANLSFVQIKKYLNDLLEQELLKHEGSYYFITKKGIEFVELYDKYTTERKILEEQVDKSAKERLLLENMCSNGNCSNQ